VTSLQHGHHGPDGGQRWVVTGPPADATIDRVGPGGGVASDSAFGVALVTLWQQVAEAGGAVGFPPPVSRSEVAGRTAGLVDEIRTGRLLAVAANHERRLIGVGLLRPGRGSGRHTGRIVLLLVQSAMTGYGVGTTLLDELLLLARAGGVERLEVDVQDGTGLPEFFARFGFTEWGRRPGWIRLDAAEVRDEVVLGLLTAPSASTGSSGTAETTGQLP
jgi:GNAT superfamily N-acetyltransferase